ncbi:MAG: PKD domain-containing protein, partial [Candidatus Thermoplasmatota archaeon]
MRRFISIFLFIHLIASSFFIYESFAEDTELFIKSSTTLFMNKTSSQPTIDGDITAGEWQCAKVFDISGGNKDVLLYIMFDDKHLYIGIDALGDKTNDQGKTADGYVTSPNTDSFLLMIDGEGDGKVTYSDNANDGQPSHYPITMPTKPNPVVKDRWASVSGGGKPQAGWNLIDVWNNSQLVFWYDGSSTPNNPSQNKEPYDYINSGFSDHRTYEYRVPYSAELGTQEKKDIGIFIQIYDARGGVGDRLIGFIGSSAPYTPQIFTIAQAPVANIKQPNEKNNMFLVNTEVQFDATGTTDDDTASLAYSWDFGDGSIGIGMKVKHSYSSATVYTVKLMVTDKDGYSDNASICVMIKEDEVPPVIESAYTTALDSLSPNPVITETENITFYITFRDDNEDQYDEKLYVKWYVNGEVKKSGYGSKQSNYTFFTNYDSNGTYSISVTVTDQYNASGLWTGGPQTAEKAWFLTVKNKNRKPKIVSAEPYFGGIINVRENEQVNLKVNVKDDDKDELKIQWYLDSSLVETKEEFIYLPDYNSSGRHKVKVVVTDTSNEKDELSWDIEVENVNQAPKIISNSPANKNPTTNEEKNVVFTIVALDPDDDRLQIDWYVGDEVVAKGEKTSYTFTPSYSGEYSSFYSPYKIKAVVSDGSLFDEYDWVLTVEDVNRLPEVYISRPDEGYVFNLTDDITFDASESLDLDGDSLSYTWAFGDGKEENKKTVKHKYDEEGEYEVVLTVSDGISAVSKSVNITVAAAKIQIESMVIEKKEMEEGKETNVIVTIKNVGKATCEEVYVELYIDKRLEKREEAKLFPNEKRIVNFKFIGTKGTHTITCKVVAGRGAIIVGGDEKSDIIVVKGKAGVGEGINLPIILFMGLLVCILACAGVFFYMKKRARLEGKPELILPPVTQPQPEPTEYQAPPVYPSYQYAPQYVSPQPIIKTKPVPIPKIPVREVELRKIEVIDVGYQCPKCSMPTQFEGIVCELCSAKDTLAESETVCMSIKGKGINIGRGEEFLQKAREALADNKPEVSKAYAKNAEENARTMEIKYQNVSEALQQFEASLPSLVNRQDAEALLVNIKEFINGGMYDDAEALIERARALGEAPIIKEEVAFKPEEKQFISELPQEQVVLLEKCKKCNSEIEKGWGFCPYCMEKLEVGVQEIVEVE